MNAGIALLLAYALDLAFGEPPNHFHPVAWMGRLIERGRDWALGTGPGGQLARGAAVAILIPVFSAGVAVIAVKAASPSRLLSFVATALLLKPMFAVRGLRDAAFG